MKKRAQNPDIAMKVINPEQYQGWMYWLVIMVVITEWTASIITINWAYGNGKGMSRILAKSDTLTRPRPRSWNERDRIGAGATST
mmetsp:Transcript_37646/g.77014  ORF Transcript_37646/g.77014 Transcript_37646/m.77014 type:complete len:85 (-) Transcript_37646:593-847(-)